MASNETQIPQIEYPRVWDYRLMGCDLNALQQCVLEIVGHRPHSHTPSNVSSGGKFVSLLVSLEVENADDRDAVFLAFKSHPAVRMVL